MLLILCIKPQNRYEWDCEICEIVKHHWTEVIACPRPLLPPSVLQRKKRETANRYFRPLSLMWGCVLRWETGQRHQTASPICLQLSNIIPTLCNILIVYPKIILTGSLYTINLPWVLWFWSAACKSVGRLGFGLGTGVGSLWWCLLWSQATSSLPVLGFVYNLPSPSSSTSLSSGHGVSTYNTKA